ncbi:MAG: transposase [Bacteroidetes bacterium]|nr:transposase [Bacteroidota bacterium]
MKTSQNFRNHNRKSIRLKGYDYSQAGLYFVTLCCQDRECLFGTVTDSVIHLNDAGMVAKSCWLEIPEHFPNVVLHEFVIMPNHIHGIIEITEKIPVEGTEYFPPDKNQIVTKNRNINKPANVNSHLPRSPSGTVGSIVRGFKIGVTKWMRNNTNIHNVWQRNYHDWIIRNTKSYQNITRYIMNNPAKWSVDSMNKK